MTSAVDARSLSKEGSTVYGSGKVCAAFSNFNYNPKPMYKIIVSCRSSCSSSEIWLKSQYVQVIAKSLKNKSHSN
jgi:hypothetical protein